MATMKDQQTKFTIEKPQFFKVVLQDSLRHQMLKIPDLFVKKYGKNLQDQVKIEVPTGQVWTVKLKKKSEHVWLHDGWSDFASFYSICHMSFILFRYEGCSYFHAFIFDPTSLEIDYPFLYNDKSDYDSDSDFVMPEIEDTDIYTSGGDDDDYISPTNHKEKGKFPMVQSSRPKKTNSFGYLESTFRNRNMKFSYPLGPIAPCGRCLQENSQRMPTITATDRYRAMQRAKDFRSENPFFVVLLQPSYATGKYLNVPNEFAYKYLGVNLVEIMLRVDDGKSWQVQYVCSPKPKFSVGWRSFARDNSIRVGDVCIFEFIKGREFSLRVIIFRDNEDGYYGYHFCNCFSN